MRTQKHAKNLDMNPETYKLRRKVMRFIYEAKKLRPNIPRINVRIAEEDPCANGWARLGRQNAIWISSNGMRQSLAHLRHTVYHELVHTICNVGHDESSPLMKSRHPHKTSKSMVQKEFMKYVDSCGY